MESNFKIIIPKPCNEDWNQMTPDETGRFCNSCVKSVVDFSGMKSAEIQNYFIKHQGQKICGRFKTEQLDSIIIQIPREILFSQIQFHKMFLLALLISMPGIVSSQNTSGTKQKIDKVEVVDSTSEKTVGRVKLDTMVHHDVVMTPERKARKEKLEALKKLREAQKKNHNSMVVGKVARHLTGDVVVVPNNQASLPIKKEFYTPMELEKVPSFPGGLTKFYDYVNSNLKISEEDKTINSKIFFSFIVNRDGSLSDFKMLRGINERLNNEVLRVLKASPAWIPGEQNGEKVKVLFSLPIKITAKE